jgi:hypothetical protein
MALASRRCATPRGDPNAGPAGRSRHPPVPGPDQGNQFGVQVSITQRVDVDVGKRSDHCVEALC